VQPRAAVHVFPGEQKVIRGFDEGVIGMKPGEVRDSIDTFAPQTSCLLSHGSACELMHLPWGLLAIVHGDSTVCPINVCARSSR